MINFNDKLIVLTGPGSVGKDAVVARLLDKYEGLSKVVTTTSRSPRPWEIPGKDYNFLSPEQFEELIKTNQLLEYVKFAGNYYGTTKDALQPFLDGKCMVWKVEISRGAQIKELFEQNYPGGFPELLKRTLVIYLDVPDWDILRERLKKRGANEEVVKQRLEADKKDWMAFKDRFQNIVINIPGKLNRTIDEVNKLLKVRFTPGG